MRTILTEKWMTIDEAAELLNYSRDTIERAIKSGKLRAIKPNGGRSYRLALSDLCAWSGYVPKSPPPEVTSNLLLQVSL